MNSGLTVPAYEVGVIRVFALDPNDPGLAAILPPHPLDGGHLGPLLGVADIRDEDVERISIGDLGDYSLSEFLRIGHDVRTADLDPIRADLDALTGQILLVHSKAFGEAATTITPAAGIRFLGALRRNEAPATPISLPEAEKPEVLTPPANAASKGRVGSGLLIGIALFALMSLVLIWGIK